MLCRDCGKLIAYDNKPFTLHSYTNKLLYNRGNGGLSFLSERVYNGNTYHLCRCYDCVCKAYPEFNDVRFKFAHKAAKYTQYGFGVSDEDFGIVAKERQSVTKDKMIKKYGLNEGQKLWNSYCEKQSVTNTFEYKKEKYGMTEEEFDLYNKSRSVSLENMIARYGEIEGQKRWDEYCERQRYTCSKEYFIEKYGYDEGLFKYMNFSEKRNNTYRVGENGISEISLSIFDVIKKEFKNNKIYYNDNEKHVRTLQDHVYFLDYYDETLNIVIEFYGTYWHMDPKKYPDDYIMRVNPKKNITITAKDKRDRDTTRIKDIQETLDCKVIVVWESTYRSDKVDTVAQIIDMIKNKECLEDITYI